MGRLRIFAGPNGSGKSTFVNDFEFNMGFYINADDLLNEVIDNETYLINFSKYGITTSKNEFVSFCKKHGLYSKLENSSRLTKSDIIDDVLVFSSKPDNYEIAIVTDFLRTKLLKTNNTFSFETVFSHKGKVDFIKKANSIDYRTYLYFFCTETVSINIDRVKQRVSQGGHDVPVNKIKDRYVSSLQNLLPAIRLAYKSYIFDNSQKGKPRLFATVSDKTISILPGEDIPQWFQEYVINKL